MTQFILVRHATPDYSIIDKRHYRGFGNDLAPITKEGEQEAKKVCEKEILKDADLILASPYTRTLQTAAIMSKELNIPFKVEIDLMEWIPDRTYMYDEYARVVKWRKHYDENNGKNTYPEDNFEEKEEIVARVNEVLKNYTNYSKVIVVTHGMVINALTGVIKPACTQTIPYTL